MYRLSGGAVELFLAHPGGPYFAGRDEGAWTVPKGVFDGGEEPLAAACREFEEETGRAVADCATAEGFTPLGEIVQRGGKRVVAWAFAGDWPEGEPVLSNTCSIELPRGSGRWIEIPEIDRAAFFPVERALEKIKPAQLPLVERLLRHLAEGGARPGVDSAR